MRLQWGERRSELRSNGETDDREPWNWDYHGRATKDAQATMDVQRGAWVWIVPETHKEDASEDGEDWRERVRVATKLAQCYRGAHKMCECNAQKNPFCPQFDEHSLKHHMYLGIVHHVGDDYVEIGTLCGGVF